MLKCREVSHLVGSDEVRAASLRTRLEVRLHLLMCRACRRYASQLLALGRAVRRRSSTGSAGGIDGLTSRTLDAAKARGLMDEPADRHDP